MSRVGKLMMSWLCVGPSSFPRRRESMPDTRVVARPLGSCLRGNDGGGGVAIKRVDRWRSPAVSGALFLALATAGCASKPPEAERFYRPTIAAPEARAKPAARLLVEPFEARGIYSDRALVIRDADGTYRQAIGRSWVEPPSLLLGTGLADYLRAAYGGDAVFLPQARVDADVTIRSTLKRFERVKGEGASGDTALLAVDFVVTARGGALLGTLEFSDSTPVASGSAEYVAAQSELLTRASAALLALLDRRLPEVRSGLKPDVQPGAPNFR